MPSTQPPPPSRPPYATLAIFVVTAICTALDFTREVMFVTPLADGPVPVRWEPSTQIAPALLMAYGAASAEPAGTNPLADIHIDLPAEDESEDDPTLVELPIDDGQDEGGDTERVPL